MSEDREKNVAQEQPRSLDKREALKKIGRYAAYTAPATLVALGYTTSQAGPVPESNGGSPPPPLTPPPAPPPPSESPPPP
jgi:hypothetical protein